MLGEAPRRVGVDLPYLPRDPYHYTGFASRVSCNVCCFERTGTTRVVLFQWGRPSFSCASKHYAHARKLVVASTRASLHVCSFWNKFLFDDSIFEPLVCVLCSASRCQHYSQNALQRRFSCSLEYFSHSWLTRWRYDSWCVFSLSCGP